MFLCPSRFLIVPRPTPPFTSSVACVCLSWWSVISTPALRQYPTHKLPGRLVAQAAPVTIDLRTEQRPSRVALLLEVAPQPPHQLRVIQQHRPPMSSLPEHGHMLVVGRKVQVLDVQPQWS